MTQAPKKEGPRMTGGFPLWASATTSRRNCLLEFKAGKMYRIGNMVHPDPRKGLVYLYQDDYGVIHLCWMDRTTGIVEDDYHTEPMDCTYSRIEKCRTGRVYALKMKKTKRTIFFWMQEPQTDKDSFISTRVRNLLDFPPPMIMFPDRVSVPGHGEVSLNTLRLLLNRITSEARAAPGHDDAVWIDVRGQPAGSGLIESRPNIVQSTSKAEAQPNPPQQSAVFVNLADVINEESIRALKKPKYQRKMEDKLPPVSVDSDNVEKTLKSSQLREAFEDFSVALKSGKTGQLVKDCGVSREAVVAAENGDVDKFINALQEHETRPKRRSALKNSGKPPANPADKEKDRQNGRKSDESGSDRREPSEKPGGSNGRGGSKSRDSTQKEEVDHIPADECVSTVQENQQQTEPVSVKPATVPAARKISVKIPERPNTSAGAADVSSNRDRAQNTDPVRIKASPKPDEDSDEPKRTGSDEKK